MTPAAGDRLVVGRIGRAHGLRGEVAVRFSSNRPERTEPGAVLYADARALALAAARPPQDRVLIRFEGVDDRTAAEALQGLELSADRLSGDEAAVAAHEIWIQQLDA